MRRGNWTWNVVAAFEAAVVGLAIAEIFQAFGLIGDPIANTERGFFPDGRFRKHSGPPHLVGDRGGAQGFCYATLRHGIEENSRSHHGGIAAADLQELVMQ
jgi:hypothetical protein